MRVLGKKALSIFMAIVVSMMMGAPAKTFAESVVAESAEQQTESVAGPAEQQIEKSGQEEQAGSSSGETEKPSGETEKPDEQEDSATQAFTVKFMAVNEAGNILSGAVFKVEDENGRTQEIESEAGLVPGVYLVSEKKAPDGYNISDTMKFKVDTDGGVFVDEVKQKDNTVSIVNQEEETEAETIDSEEITEADSPAKNRRSKLNVLRMPETASDASAHMHAAIKASNDTYESGTTAIISVKYTLDQNSIHAGDYVIVTIPKDIASKVSFSLNSQHFKSAEDLGNGQYRLTFASNIESGLAGSFNAYVTTNKVEKTTEGTIIAGDASRKITVVPSGSPGGTGTYTDTLMKDAAGNDGVSYGGYDYSDGIGDRAAQIGIADLANGGTYEYRLFINDKQGEISDVTVTDRIPDGMTFNREKGIEVTDRGTGAVLNPASYSVDYEGQALIFRYPGTFSNIIQVNYWVDIPAGSNASKFTNTATITYAQNGDIHQEHRSYVLQGMNNNASNGEKSVDKSIISTDPDDQLVTYTIKFWNSNGFAEREIRLIDQLDSYVTFVGSESNEYFSVEQDSTDPQKIKITNTKAIEGSLTTYVRFMVDMSRVPVGYTVKNTVGGNTTRTTKYDGGLELNASKQVNGGKDGITEGQFNFQLLSSGEVLQTKINDANGNISFDRISYTFDDVGKTFIYQVKEVAGNDETYEYNQSIYTITVTPTLEKDSNGNPTGKILAEPVITSGDKAADSIVFNNTMKTGSLKLTKISKGHDTPADAEFTVTGLEGYSRTVKYSDLQDGSITLNGLPTGMYTVQENKADVDGYTLAANGNTTAEVVRDGTAEITLTNTYTQNTGSLKLTKISKGHDTPADAEFTVTGPDGYSRTVKYSDLQDGSITLNGLPTGMYTVQENKADVDGYTLAANGNTTAEVVRDGTAEITLTNTYTPDTKTSKPSNENNQKTGLPRTGDETNLIAWFILLAGSFAIVVLLVWKKRKKNNSKRQTGGV